MWSPLECLSLPSLPLGADKTAVVFLGSFTKYWRDYAKLMESFIVFTFPSIASLDGLDSFAENPIPTEGKDRKFVIGYYAPKRELVGKGHHLNKV
jgi:hypothetical protein